MIKPIIVVKMQIIDFMARGVARPYLMVEHTNFCDTLLVLTNYIHT